MSASGIIGLALWALWMLAAVLMVHASNWDNDPEEWS